MLYQAYTFFVYFLMWLIQNTIKLPRVWNLIIQH